MTRPNLVSQQRSTITKLGSNPHLVIKPFYKGSWMCLMDTFIYISKIEDHLADPSTYKELNSDTTEAIRNDVLFPLDYLYNTHPIDDITRHHLMLPKPAHTPLFYGLPKVHKPNIPTTLTNSVSMRESHRSSLELCHPLHTTSCGDTPLIHSRQQTLSTAS